MRNEGARTRPKAERHTYALAPSFPEKAAKVWWRFRDGQGEYERDVHRLTKIIGEGSGLLKSE